MTMQFGISKVIRDKDTKELGCLGEDWKVGVPQVSPTGLNSCRWSPLMRDQRHDPERAA